MFKIEKKVSGATSWHFLFPYFASVFFYGMLLNLELNNVKKKIE